MSKQPDLLAEVIQALDNRRGDLRTVASAVGLSYDTVLRIRRRSHDPGYSKVVALHAYLFDTSPNEAASAPAS